MHTIHHTQSDRRKEGIVRTVQPHTTYSSLILTNTDGQTGRQPRSTHRHNSAHSSLTHLLCYSIIPRSTRRNSRQPSAAQHILRCLSLLFPGRSRHGDRASAHIVVGWVTVRTVSGTPDCGCAAHLCVRRVCVWAGVGVYVCVCVYVCMRVRVCVGACVCIYA